MAAEIFRINPGKAFSGTLGPTLLNVIENLNQSFAQLLLLRAAIIQQEDDNSGTDTAFVTPAATFGFVGPDGLTLSSTVAHQAFTEIDSMQNTCAAALQQMCARFKQ
jgi:hypothetical protein